MNKCYLLNVTAMRLVFWFSFLGLFRLVHGSRCTKRILTDALSFRISRDCGVCGASTLNACVPELI